MTGYNTHTWMNWRSDSSWRNGATLWCRAKNPADVLKTFVAWDLRNKRPSQFLVRPKSYRHQLTADTNVAHEIRGSFIILILSGFFGPRCMWDTYGRVEASKNGQYFAIDGRCPAIVTAKLCHANESQTVLFPPAEAPSFLR
jgi:hypothetical protein